MKTVTATKIVLGVWVTAIVAAFAGGVYAGATGGPNPVIETLQKGNSLVNLVLGYGALYLLYRLLEVKDGHRKVVGGFIGLFVILAFFGPGLPVFWLLGLLGWRGIRRLVTGRGTPTRDFEAERRARDAELDRLAGILPS